MKISSIFMTEKYSSAYIFTTFCFSIHLFLASKLVFEKSLDTFLSQFLWEPHAMHAIPKDLFWGVCSGFWEFYLRDGAHKV
jgi:hypothetical protein